ncbi:MAG: undecaprenyl-phosphate glucose phosphotransferase [Rhodoferax sp.]|nr:undecaprenyl-phosphate glucose phosphotransferase [Rhodoferax sp.]
MIDRRRRIRLSSPMWSHVAIGLDAVLIAVCALATFKWYLGQPNLSPALAHYSVLVLAALVLMFAFSNNFNRSWRGSSLVDMLKPVVLSWFYTLAIITGWLFVSKSSSDVSRVWFGSWALSTLFAMSLVRLVIHSGLRWLRSKGYNFKMVLIVGTGPSSEFAQKSIQIAPWSGLQIQAVLAPPDLARFINTPGQRQPDEVWLCLQLGDRAGIESTLAVLRHSTANIRMVPDWFSLKLMNHGVSEVVGLQMLDLSMSPITGATRIVKQIEDVVLAALILLLISPLMVLIALAIKLTSPGPVLFKQTRHGWNGEMISVYKFRSMVVHQERDFKVTQACRNDARITPLGAFLRRTSLDELPQFFNVLSGSMSIVGPRPHAVQHNEHYKELVPGYMWRHKVKPGITGWAQVNGFRGETDTLRKMEQRVTHDLFYIENISLWFDLKIIFLTVFKGFTHPNAH